MDVRLDEVVLRALEKEPERRYQQVSQMKSAVETISQSCPPVDTNPQPADWRTWRPFQSRQVREICDHMTEAERRELTLRGALFGIWNAATFFVPWGIFLFAPKPVNWIFAPIVLLVGLAFYPLWQRMMREFLASTSWARQQGIAPESLRMSPQIILVGRRGNRAVIRWPGVLLSFLRVLVLAEAAAIVASSALVGQIDSRSVGIAFVSAVIFIGILVRRGLRTPIEQLTPRDEPSGTGPPSPLPTAAAPPADASHTDSQPSADRLSPWCRIVGIALNGSFTSPLAIKLVNISALGFLGALAFLAFVPLPGMHRCVGFAGFCGFFGLIGVAVIIENSSQRKAKKAAGNPPNSPPSEPTGSSPRPEPQAGASSPRLLKGDAGFVTTPEQLGTFEGQLFLWHRRSQLLLDERQLTVSRAGVFTVIPLAAIRDLSIGHYGRVMHPAGLDFISVTYDADGQTQRLYFSPYESWFGLPSSFNRIVAEWFNAIRAAVLAATGREPGNTPANQLGVPSASKALYALLLAPVVLGGTLVAAVLLLRLSGGGAPRAPEREPPKAAVATVPAEPQRRTTHKSRTFGPVIERVIATPDADDQGLVFFDVETGKSFKPPFPLTFHPNQGPAFVELTPELKQWIKARDVDVLLHLGEKTWDLMTLQMQEDFAGQLNEWETISPDKVIGVFAKKDADHLVRDEVPASSFGHSYRDGFGSFNAFRTRSNTMGVYQFEGVDNSTRRGVGIRYKLVQEDGEAHRRTPEQATGDSG